jgi:serine/threonine protein kinase
MTISLPHDLTSQPSAGMDPDLTFIDHEVSQRLFGASRKQIGRYSVVEVLGSGGMGLVYLATDDHLRRRIAIKLLNSQSHTSEGMERLLREARAMARVSHPGVVQIYEAGVQSSQVVIAMEYVQGTTLSEWAMRTRAWRDVREMFVAIGKGVCAAHAVGIIHRDLKPSNILIDPIGHPKVADFGLARENSEDPRESAGTTAPRLQAPDHSDLTVPGALLGTPRYMSPEQHQGQAVSFSSDQYSFCVVMWEVLYRQYPFAVVDEDGLCAAKLSAQVISPPSGARVPARLRKALLRGLRTDPADRWPTMQALVAEIERDLWPRRLPWILAVAGLLAAPVAYLTQSMASEVPGATCAEAYSERISTVWNDHVRRELSQHFGRADIDWLFRGHRCLGGPGPGARSLCAGVAASRTISVRIVDRAGAEGYTGR